jgi:hypothetical protein
VTERIEWNPAGDTWSLGTVLADKGGNILIQLDENGQVLTVERRHVTTIREGQ